jgi:tetratricopeptide (TPR) repeat protein
VFLLALLSKTSVVMLPFVLLGFAWWQRGLIEKKDLVRTVPFFVLAGALGIVTVWFQYNVAIGDDIVRTDSFLSRLAGAGWAVWFYLYKVLIPHNLSFVYPRWEIDASSAISYLPLIVLVICFVTFWRYRQNWGRAFLFGFGYFVVTLLPVLGFFDINFMRFSFVTDHWQYFSIPGVIALVVGLGVWVRDRLGRNLRWSFRVACVAAVCVLGCLTWKHSYAFKDLEALWRDTISKNPEAWLAQANLGSTLAAQGKYDKAIRHCYEALRINPTHPWIHCALGTALVGQRRFEDAIGHFSQALRLDPDFAQAHQAHNDLGLLLAKTGRLDEAIGHFSEAVAKKGDFAEAHYNLGLALALRGRDNEAIREFSEAIRLEPNHAQSHLNLGSIYAKQGQLDDAIGHFSEALRIKPDFPEAKHYLRQATEDVRMNNAQ